MADVMRQSIRLGLPKLREQLSGNPLKPFTEEEGQRAFGPKPEFDELEQHCARLSRASLSRRHHIILACHRAGANHSRPGTHLVGAGEQW